MVIVEEYDADCATTLVGNLASQTAEALGIQPESIEAPSIVASELYDEKTGLSVNAIQFSFILAQTDRLTKMVTSGTLRLFCSSGFSCEIPAKQDLKGSVTYELMGTSQFSDDYYQLTGRKATMNVLRFNFSCATTTSSDINRLIVKQLYDYGFESTFQATRVRINGQLCDRSAVFFYSFKLQILNDYATTVGNDSALFLASIKAQLIKLFNIPPDLFSIFSRRSSRRMICQDRLMGALSCCFLESFS